MLPREILTARLRLRAVTMADAATIFHGYAQDTDVIRYLSFKRPAAIGETEDFVRLCVDQWRDGTSATWTIGSRDGNAFLGAIGLASELHGREVGYCLVRDAWGRGYVLEALRSVLTAAFALPATYRVWAGIHVANQRSIRVVEKADMRLEGRLRQHSVFPNLGDEPLDVLCYARTRDDGALD